MPVTNPTPNPKTKQRRQNRFVVVYFASPFRTDSPTVVIHGLQTAGPFHKKDEAQKWIDDNLRPFVLSRILHVGDNP